jgi:UDP-N-acetylglucosamine 1-carboxyvinyltransferase
MESHLNRKYLSLTNTEKGFSMGTFKIQGGSPLNGSVRLGGAKNASFKIMIASLLGSTESRLLNFSRISEVDHVAECIKALGGKVTRRGERALFIDPTSLSESAIPESFGETSRSAPMFIPVLLHKFGRAYVPTPGGDKLGKRPIDWHLQALMQMGADIQDHGNALEAKTDGLHGITYRFPKNSHTGTETVIMAAVLAKGKTIIENAALEPEVDDLIDYLNNCGARIRRRHQRIIEIEGVESISGTIHQIMPDRNEAITYACAAIVTKGDIIVENAQEKNLTAFLEKLSEANGGFEVGSYGIRFFYKGTLQPTDVETMPHPGFMTDWQPLWAVLATQMPGPSVIHEKVYPSRFQYIEHLVDMGAQIDLFSPNVTDPEKAYNFAYQESLPPHHHAARFMGNATLDPGEFTCRDLRHGATLVLAALAARGTSLIHNIEQIDRGYEDLDIRLRELGAIIDRV